jgi:hypothetical protein
VRIISDQANLAGGGSFAGSYSAHGPNSENLYVWIVLVLLVASTTLALYDLYVLISAVTGGT